MILKNTIVKTTSVSAEKTNSLYVDFVLGTYMH